MDIFFVKEALESGLPTEELMKLMKIEKILIKNRNKDLNKIEDEFFEKYNCKNEIDKIKFECKYINTKMKEEKENLTDNKYYDDDSSIVNIIRKNADLVKEVDKTRINSIKKALVYIELDLGIGINFYSVIREIYDEKLEKLEEKLNKKGL